MAYRGDASVGPVDGIVQGQMEAWPVSTIVNKVQNDGPELLERSEVDGPAQKLPPTQMDLF